MDDYTESQKLEVNIPDSKPFKEEEEIEEDEKETPPEPSTDEKPDETTEQETEEPEAESDDEPKEEEIVPEKDVEVDSEPKKKTPKPVEGETPKEFALRKELERERKKVRNLMSKQLNVKKQDSDIFVDDKDSLKDYDPDEITRLDKILQSRGYVRKDELQKQTFKDQTDHELNVFLKEHKEYLPENDKENVLWNQFKEEFSILRKPANVDQYKDFLERTHKSIFCNKTINKNTAAAAKEKLQVASHGSTTVNKPKVHSKSSSITPEMKSHLKGFTDEEIEDMFGS